MPSVILPPAKHQKYTNLWGLEVPYKSTFDNKKILRAAAKIYNTEPELMGAAI